MRTWFSEFSTPLCGDIVVGIVDESDGLYPALKPLFDEYGYGFADMNSATIYIDGGIGLDTDELKWIEAHEAAHIISGSLDERETDLFAYRLLIDKGYHRSAELLIENMNRHEI